eukprot:TRINITY_DN5908_c0_g2_i1.p5 TRINITY_DN5908_c0_g2~~TRINITY_DN5908_c0_g2_i1.p5  ORF type:complete len:128 (-),score=14.20 TRINITY_DN5908_c0_g2_i1:781-1164(-)
MYCGVATRENRLKWSIFGVFITVGFVLLITYLCVFGRCYDEYESSTRYGDIKYDNSEECGTRYGWLVWLAILSWIICSIPLYMMCCCTKKPDLLHSAWAELEMEGQEFTHVPQSQPTYEPLVLKDTL